MKTKFAYRDWVGGEYFDGSSGTKRGKAWFTTDAKTPFPVLEYELKVPR